MSPRQNRRKAPSAPARHASGLRGMGQPQTLRSDAPSLPLDAIRFWMAEGRYEAAMAENARLRQRLNALDALIAYMAPALRDEDGYRA